MLEDHFCFRANIAAIRICNDISINVWPKESFNNRIKQLVVYALMDLYYKHAFVVVPLVVFGSILKEKLLSGVD